MKMSSKILIFILFFSFLILPVFVSAQLGNLDSATPDAIRGNSSLPEFVGNVVKGIIALLGVVFLCLILYAGFTWLTAEGEPDKVKKAKEMIRNGIIGIIIVLMSYAIADFVITNLIVASN